ncbi:MAG TPA: hypothetical protein VEI50_02025 [Nitrospiraceae bacterium]|nr:hypothetical protein [Nitrospiraceae bacterium]
MPDTIPSNNGVHGTGLPQSPLPRTQPARQRVTVSLPTPLVERLRNAVYWTGHYTLAQTIVDSLEDTLTAMEHANGGPFPGRLAPLKSGRRPRKPPPSHLIATESSSGACVAS